MHDTNHTRRTVRSFVRRTGRLTPSQAKALQIEWPAYGLDFEPQPLSFATVFGNDNPVVLEIGFGNGESLVEQAAQHPKQNFLGIEVHDPGVGHCLLRARDKGIANLRVIVHDAVEVLTIQIPARSLSRVNLYFPDPWPKKRHHKRRIIQPDFLDLVAERLCAGGTLNIATDWANYAEHIDAVLGQSMCFSIDERREHGGQQPLDRPQTKFELRGLRKGHRIVDWCATRKA